MISVYDIATAQIQNTTNRSMKQTVSHYFASCYHYMKFSRGTGIPTYVTPAQQDTLRTNPVENISNGVLRAHTVKAEACLLMALLYLLEESMTGYIKCGLNLRRGKKRDGRS